MTYQYLTVEMVKAAKANGGFIDQKTFKNAGKYYQKRRSRKVGVKAYECLQKLQGTKGLEVDMEVNTGFGSSSASSTATFEPAIECSRSENTRPKTDTPPHSNRLLSQGHQRRPLRFTTHEDDFLIRGIDKHGFGRRTAILRDPDFFLQKGRLADCLKKRAELRFLSNENPQGTVLAERLETRGKEF